MNIEELSKSQLLLLMLLVNFVTSIATGILTVSLLDHLPPVVTQTVNRIVEHTVETVAPAPVVALIKNPTPVVATPTAEDLTVAALAAEATRTVTIYPGTGTSSPALGTGTYLSKARAVATALNESFPKQALIEFPNGQVAEVSLSRTTSTVMIYGFADKASLPLASVPLLVPSKNLKLGQSVLGITADGTAATGIISKIGTETISTTLPKIPKGSAAVDLSGNIVGIANGEGTYTNADFITTALAATSTAAAKN